MTVGIQLMRDAPGRMLGAIETTPFRLARSAVCVVEQGALESISVKGYGPPVLLPIRDRESLASRGLRKVTPRKPAIALCVSYNAMAGFMRIPLGSK